MTATAFRCAVSVSLTWVLMAAGCHGGSEAKEQESEPRDKARKAPAGEVWLNMAQVKDAKLVVNPAEIRELNPRLQVSGRIAFHDLYVSKVYAPMTGKVVRISAAPGQKVKKGDPLATILSPDVGMSASDVAKARADLLGAELEYKRQKDLAQVKAGSQREYEQALFAYEKAKAELERAQKKNRLFRGGDAVEQGYVVRAPIDGEIVARNVNPGTEVQGQYGAGATTPELFVVGSIEKVWALIDVFEQDFTRIKLGTRVAVKVVAYQKKEFEGQVEWVSPALDPTTRTAKVRVTIENPDRLLKPEMFATASITTEGQKILSVPERAVLRLREQPIVFIEKGKSQDGRMRFERRVIAVADDDKDAGFLPVLKGIKEGERVVESGAILLSANL
jgi:cobalt-zinc-cadmium efflux system membrane fusion protein